MQKLTLDEYQRLRANGEVLEYDLHGEKVVRRPDDTLLKLFRRKRLFSSALLRPYAQRFANNCARLAALHIPCPQVIAVRRVPAIERDVVHYHPLPGQTIRQMIAAGTMDTDFADQLRIELGKFIATLHARGIYFRSLHLGNIVRTPEGGLGLIDVADMVVQRRPLTTLSIRRNMQHLLRYPADRVWLEAGRGFFEAMSMA